MISERIAAMMKLDYEYGTPIFELAYKYSVHRKAVARKIKSGKWIKGHYKELVEEEARIEVLKMDFGKPQIEFHKEKVREMASNIRYIEKVTIKNIKAMMEKMTGIDDIKDHKLVQETINLGATALGVIGKSAGTETTVTTKTVNDFYDADS